MPARRSCSKTRCQTQRTIQNPDRHFDSNQQYSITALTDGGGTVVERYAYTAYGQVTFADAGGSVQTASASNNRYTYTGREWDQGLSLYHYRARMYDSISGRFISRDPIGYWDGLGLYLIFVSLSRLDPQGTSASDATDGAVAEEPKLNPVYLSIYKTLCGCSTEIKKAADVSSEGTVVCSGGNFAVFIPSPSTDEEKRERELRDTCGITDCVQGHEQTHIDYFKAACADGFCKDKTCERDEVVSVTISGAPICKQLHECVAHAGSLACAVRKLKQAQGQGNGECERVATDFLEKELVRYSVTYSCPGLPESLRPKLDNETIDFLEQRRRNPGAVR